MEHAELIRNYIIDNFLFGEENGLKENTSFLEEGILDSTGVLELVTFIEATFGFVVEDEDLVPENLDSIQNLIRYIQHKTQVST